MPKHLVIIGRNEIIDVVDMATDIPAKIDTGAFRSAIHAKNVKVVTENGKKILKCQMLGHPCAPIKGEFTTDKFDKVVITNSFGHREERFEVKLKVKLGNKIITTSFTLADRSNNMFPVLVGRKLLKNRFLVDVTKTNVDRMKLRKDFGIKAPLDEEDLE